jgi:hypothetical protein
MYSLSRKREPSLRRSSATLVALLCLLTLCAEKARAQTPGSVGQGRAASFRPASSKNGGLLHVGAAVPLPVEGVPQQIFSYAATRGNPRHLLACSSEVDSRNARVSSAAYTSFDGGNTWMRTLLDTQSDWVTETTCAMGSEGRAYFAAGVSNTSHGDFDHSSGSAELYRSSDDGLHWSKARRYPFIDWMQLAADEGSNEYLHLFGNQQAEGVGDSGAGAWVEKRRPMWKMDDELTLSAPTFPSGVPADNHDQGFPLAAVVDGEKVIALFGEIPSRSFVIYQADASGYRMLSKVPMPPEARPYGTLSAQMTMDRAHHRLYVAVPALVDKHAVVVLARSGDGGSSWNSTVLIREDIPMPTDEIVYMYTAVAVNADGIVGLEWFPGIGCPRFAVSTDAGASVADSMLLGSCDRERGQTFSRFAMEANVNVYNDRSPVDHPLTYSASALPGFSVRASASMLGSVHLTADAMGRFHPFWTEPRWDGIKTFTAAVSIGLAEPEAVPLSELADVSPDYLVRVANATVDPIEGTYSADISVRNSGSAFMPYPLWLQAVTDRSDCGALRYLNPSGVSKDGHAIFRVPEPLDRQLLFPGEDSLPVHIVIDTEGCGAGGVSMAQTARQSAMKLRSFFPVSVRFHIYARSPEPAKSN